MANALESDTLEFKTQGRSVPETLEGLAEATACLANARGGMVVVGVADGVAGTDAFVVCDLDPLRTQRRIFELTDPHLTATVDPCDWRGRPLLIVTVPVSPDVHAVAARITERIGASCQPMSTSRIRDRGGGPPSQRLVRRRRRNPFRRRRCRCARPGPHDAQALERPPASRLRAPDLRGPAAHARGGDAAQHPHQGRCAAVLRPARRRRSTQLRPPPYPPGALVVNEHLHAPVLLALQRRFDLIDARLDRTSVNLPGGQQLQLADLPEAAVREAIVKTGDAPGLGPAQE